MNSQQWIGEMEAVRSETYRLGQELASEWTTRADIAELFALDDEMQRHKRIVNAIAQQLRALLFQPLLVENGGAIMRPEESNTDLTNLTAGFRLRYAQKTVVPNERALVEALLEFNGGDLGIISTGSQGALAATPWKVGFIRERVDHKLIFQRDVTHDRDGNPVEPAVEPISEYQKQLGAKRRKGTGHD